MTQDWIFFWFIAAVGIPTAICMCIGVRDNFREELHLRFDEKIKELERTVD
jgi:hypothetical protein